MFSRTAIGLLTAVMLLTSVALLGGLPAVVVAATTGISWT
jgi:hypothetical protein